MKHSTLRRFSVPIDHFLALCYCKQEIVGFSSAVPLEKEDADVCRPLLKEGFDLKKWVYFSESVLKKDFRGLGIGKRFFNLRKEFQLRFGKN